MKIIISPSKQQKKIPYDFIVSEPKFHHKANYLASKINELSVAEIKKVFKCSYEIAQSVKVNYENFNNSVHPALFLFSGLQYKNIDVETLNNREIDFLLENLLIADSLYGILKASDSISEYRLDYNTKLPFFSYNYYKEDLENCVDEIIINLCSKEYSKNLKQDKLFHINFIQNLKGNIKSYSTHTKIARGRFVRYLAKCDSTSFDVIRAFNIDNYYLTFESENSITFQKDIL